MGSKNKVTVTFEDIRLGDKVYVDGFLLPKTVVYKANDKQLALTGNKQIVVVNGTKQISLFADSYLVLR